MRVVLIGGVTPEEANLLVANTALFLIAAVRLARAAERPGK
jgi:hypothetical protein